MNREEHQQKNQQQLQLQLFLQWIMTKRLVSEDDALFAARQIWEIEELCKEELTSRLSDLREQLRPFDLELRRSFAFDLEQYVWSIINTNGDHIAELATIYSPEQVDCFKRLLSLISNSIRYQASTVDALLQLSENNSLSKKQCEEFIESLIDQQWIIKKYEQSQRY
jgi:hypothetical protein